jgi:predicted RND superfamily exporter protein
MALGSRLFRIYDRLIFRYSKAWIAAIVLIAAGLAFKVPEFKLDASADSLVLENDEALAYNRKINKQYGTEDFLIVTYKPFDGLLSPRSIEGLKGLKEELSRLERIKSVVSILDVPLFNSPRVKLSELSENNRTLETPGVDLDLALREFTESPIYRKLLASPDGKTTALLALYKRNEKYYSLLERRNDLREKRRHQDLSPQEEKELAEVSHEFKQYLAEVLATQKREVDTVRAILDKYRDQADIFLGGIPMIATDMIDFIRSDLSTFGIAVFALMVLVMWLFFHGVRWVALPIVTTGVSVWVVIGCLGWLDWRATVISSNFVSMLIIITISLTVHLIVRYGELYADGPEREAPALVEDTVRHMFQPCFYTAITTIVAFTSLMVSGIRPVIDFGWIMTLGIAIAFTLSFILFPALLRPMRPRASVTAHDFTRRITRAIAAFALRHRGGLITGFTLFSALAVFGIFQLRVDNRFIDYFKESTEIYQGMSVIDKSLGGTTPLDLVLEADPAFFEYLEEIEKEKALEDPFDDPFASKEPVEENYWFHPDKLLWVEKIHDHLEAMPQIGKVLSIATTLKVVRLINGGRVPDDYDLAIYRKLLPEEARKNFLDPYLSKDANQIRLTLRIEETEPTLNRGELIEKINRYLIDEMNVAPERIHFTGMAVLYNNMLHSLYRSQILTLGMVLAAICVMFVILFRNISIALLATLPNVFSAVSVLGIMGWLDIPLDMMTITIAAITIGIAVDDTIHYVHRFQEEFPRFSNYQETVLHCHGTIGRAMYYTSITITVGFSILVLSNFIPTIYFGLLTGTAMILAILGDLILLPLLIVLFKPLGPETARA